jgi:hypothetical protein
LIQIHDNFHADPHTLRAHALDGKFSPIEQGGAIFPGFQLTEVIGADALAKLVGKPVANLQQAFRLYKPGDAQPTFIHQDGALASHSAILYLEPPRNSVHGTDFWNPKKDGANPMDDADWTLSLSVPGQFNRLIIFDSQLWHSRFPRHLSPSQSRLIWVAFFNTK